MQYLLVVYPSLRESALDAEINLVKRRGGGG